MIRAVSKLSAKTFRRLTFATTRAMDGVSTPRALAATLAASATARVAGFETADGGARETEAVKLADAWPLPRGEQHVVGWEHALLMDLGGAMSSFGREAITAYVGAKAVSYTALASLAAAVAWPVTLLKSASFIDSPWALAESRAVDAGEELAAALAGEKTRRSARDFRRIFARREGHLSRRARARGEGRRRGARARARRRPRRSAGGHVRRDVGARTTRGGG